MFALVLGCATGLRPLERVQEVWAVVEWEWSGWSWLDLCWTPRG